MKTMDNNYFTMIRTF